MDRKRVSKPSKKAASPFPDSELDESYDDPPPKAKPPPAKKAKGVKGKVAESRAKDSLSDSDEKESPKKRKYTPKKGTANHAFLVVLLEAHNNGEENLTKSEIMERADKSGISDKPIYGSEDSKSPGGFPIDGWTNFKTLKKHELVVAEGRPLKVHLTAGGRSVAESLVAA